MGSSWVMRSSRLGTLVSTEDAVASLFVDATTHSFPISKGRRRSLGGLHREPVIHHPTTSILISTLHVYLV